MVLLVEQQRIVASEQNLTTLSGQNTSSAVHNWETRATQALSLSEKCLIRIRGYYGVGGGSSYAGAARIVVDGTPVWSSGSLSGAAGWGTYTPEIYVVLESGSHSVLYQTSVFVSGAWAGWQQYQVIKFKFNDLLAHAASARAVGGTSGVGNAVINTNITVPSGRQTPIGKIKQYSAFIFVFGYDDDASAPTRRTRAKNIGEASDANKHNLRLYVNSVQVSWNDRKYDDQISSTSNPTYARGSFGFACLPVNAGQTLNIKVYDYHSTSNRYCQLYLTAVLCPWITTNQAYQPVALDFPQGSTFYAVLEPFYENSTTKNSKLGKARGISFGDATDFWSVASGVDVLVHTYTFEVADVSSCEWLVSCSAYVCVSHVGVDVR
ncbi:MAG: hypothetical protein IAX22_00465 [Candidatus Bathyarchaeota archaeon]|nr:hypothetical protein [Candidatus Bathyarchaeota archaeon]